MHSAVNQDGTQLAYISNLTGSPQVWVGEIAPNSTKMLYPKPITSEKTKSPHVMAPALAWIGNDQLVMLMDKNGDEQTSIEIMNFKTGEVTILEKQKGRDYLGFVSKDKQTLYFSSNRKNPAAQSLYTYNLKTKKTALIYEAKNVWASWMPIKPSQGFYFFSETTSNTSNVLKAVNPKTKVVKNIYTEPNTLIEPIALLPKNKLLIKTNNDRQFLSLAILDLKTKQIDFKMKDHWDIEIAKVSPDHKNLFVVRNVEAKSELEHYTFPGLKKLPTKFKNSGIISGIDYSAKSKTLLIGYASPTEPKNFYRISLKTRKTDRLTDNWTSRVPEEQLCYPKSIWYNSQGTKIHSWLFLPSKAKKNSRTPVIVWPHGGPQAQERAQFRPIFQYFVAKGYAIWAPNPHGSTGYGVDFTNAINGKWGTADFPDMLNGLEWLMNSKWINPDKIAIMGGSYGGYMTLRSITKISNTFTAAVDIFGVSNLVSFVKSVPPDWKPFMDKLVGNPETEHAKLAEQSPITSLDYIDCPLLVIQGATDPRVVKAESDQVVKKLKSLGKEVEYLVFEDEGHGFLKPENELKAYKVAAEFLEKYLK